MSKRRRRKERRSIQEPTEAQNQSQLVTTDSGTYEFINGGDVIKKVNGNLHDVVKTSAKNLRYGQILPHELTGIAPLITEFFKEVDYKQAAEKPWPVINEMYQDMLKNPYSIIYVCVDSDMKPHGYCWFRIERTVWGEAFVNIEHDYVIAEHRHTMKEARIHKEFLNYIVDIGERCNVKRANTLVKSKELLESRKKLGFKAVEMKLTFEGTAQDFRNLNPGYQKFGRYEKEENELENVEV